MTALYRYYILTFLLTLSYSVSAQLPSKVGSLLAADKAAARKAASEGPHSALLSVVDRNSVLFVPAPVNALDHLNSRPNIPDIMTWETNFALVSKSLEWGITSGPISFQRIGARKRQGEHLTVWKRDRKGDWKIDIRAEVEHHGNKQHIDAVFFEPDDKFYIKHRSKVRLKQREDIVLSNDKLFSSVLKSNNEAAYQEFLAEDARMLYPWFPPTIGKKAILAFLKKQKIEIVTEPEKVDRAYSGEWAYSYGTATIYQEDKPAKYNYIRVWQLQEDFQWRVLIEMLFER